MKVGLNNTNKPLPFFGAIAGLVGSFIDAAVGSAQQENQFQHDKDMAALNQRNALEQMQVQNQYQVDQWNRENEYNDPKAVAARYRAAGINPRSAFGNGSASGAGISGGLSSAPSGSNTGTSSNGMFGTNFGGLGNIINQSERIDAQNEKDLADARLKSEKAESELFERTFIKPHTARLQSALADKGISESEIKKIEMQWAPYMADLESRLKEGTLNEQLQRISESSQRISESQAVAALKEEERNLVLAEIRETEERIKSYAFERSYKRALTLVEQKRSLNIQMDTALKEAQRGHYDKLKEHVQKEIEYLGKQMVLTEQQIKKWKSDIALGWSKFGASVAQATSQEIRNWMYGFIPGVDQTSTNFYGDYVPMFAE